MPRRGGFWLTALAALLALAVSGGIGVYFSRGTQRSAAPEDAASTVALPARALAPAGEAAPSSPALRGSASAQPGNAGELASPDGTGETSASLEAAQPARLELAKMTVTGRLPERLVRAALEKERAAIEACHRPSSPLERNGRSRVQASWVIDRSGNVSNLRLRRSELSASGDTCLAAALDGMELPSPEAGVVTVFAEFEFSAR